MASARRSIVDDHCFLEHIVLHWPEGMTAADWKRQLRMFANDIMPAFQPLAVATSGQAR